MTNFYIRCFFTFVTAATALYTKGILICFLVQSYAIFSMTIPQLPFLKHAILFLLPSAVFVSFNKLMNLVLREFIFHYNKNSFVQ